jgi:hypothetical protein
MALEGKNDDKAHDSCHFRPMKSRKGEDKGYEK